MIVHRHSSHEQFSSDFKTNRNVAKNVCSQSALTCPHSIVMSGIRVFRYLGSSDGKWVVEVHDTSNGGSIHSMWAKRFSSPRASLHLFSDIASELARYYIGSMNALYPAEFIVETFNMEPV